MVAQAGLPLSALDQPDLMAPASAVIALLHAAAEASRRPDFGLRVGDAIRFSTLGAVGLLMREQPTVGEALAIFTQHMHYTTNALAMWADHADGEGVLLPVLFGRAGQTGGKPPIANQGDPLAMDMVMSGALSLLRALMGPEWRPLRLCLARPAPADPTPYLQRFGVVSFGRPLNALYLDLADLTRPITSADPALAREISRYLADRGVSAGGSFTDQVSALITELTLGGGCTVEHIAQRLGVDRRTVHRRLALEGQSFTGLVDQRRRALIAGHLVGGGRSLTTMAGLLGFSNLSSFSRWYRQVYGATARQSRGPSRSIAGQGR